MDYWYLFLVTGLLAGIVSSLFGVGAGIVSVPILVLGFAMGQKSAQGTALMAMLPMVMVGALRYKLNPEVRVDMAVVGWLAVGGMAGALVGSHIAFTLQPVVLKRLFGVFVIIAGLNILYKTRRPPVSKPAEPTPVQHPLVKD